MKVLIQWARADPQGWEQYEIGRVQDWRALPSKPMPQTLETPVDNQPGWINAICVQGLVFEKADRYSIQAASGGGIQVFSMFDHPIDNPPGQRHGHVWTIRDLAQDPALPLDPDNPRDALWMVENPRGWHLLNDRPHKMNTRQSVQWYAEPGSVVAAHLEAAGMPYLPWSQYPTPAANAQRFGKWLTYEKFREHVTRITPLPSFEDWL